MGERTSMDERTTRPGVGRRVRAVSWELSTKPLDTWRGHIPDGWEKRGDVLVFDDANTVPPGTEGTVTHVDDAGSLRVKWDNGSTIALLPGHDTWEWL
jgi:hypothetical protein